VIITLALEGSQYKRNRLIRNGGWALGGTIILSFLGLTTNILLTRLLPAADVGAYFLLVSLVMFSAIFAQAGVSQVLLRRVALSPEVYGRRGAANDVKAAMIYVGVGILFIASLILLFFDLWIAKFIPGRYDLNLNVFIIILWIVAFAYQAVVTESFRGFHNIRNAAIFGGIITNVMFVAMLGVLYAEGSKPELSDIVKLIVCLSLLSLIVGLGLLYRQIVSIEPVGYIRRLKSIYHESMPLFLSSLLMVVITQGDIWLVGYYSGNENTAIYCVAAKLAVLTGMPINLINAIIPPHISQLYAANNPHELEKLLRVSAGIASVPTIIMVFFLIFFANDILGYLYGVHFRQAGNVLRVLCIGHLGHVLLGSSGMVLMLTGRGKELMVITFINCLFLTIGGVIAAPYGIVWIGFVAASALVIQKMLMCKLVHSRLGIHTHARFDMGLFKIFLSFIGK